MTNLKEMIEKELQFDPYEFKNTEVLGVPVYYNHFTFAPCIHIRIVFRYGAIHDDIGKEGTAHFLEHMLFKGTDIFADEKAVKDFKKTIMLNSLNAHTSYFELVVKGKTLPHNLDKALSGMFSMVNAPQLNEKSYDQEKQVITQEAWEYFRNEKYLSYIREAKANQWYAFPDRLRMGNPLGYPETVLAITHEDIQKAHKTYMVKENAEIYIAGNLEGAGGIERVKNLLSDLISKMNTGTKARLPFIPRTISHPKKTLVDKTYEEIGLSSKKQASISMMRHWARIKKTPGQKSTEEENHEMATVHLASKLLSDLVYEKLRMDHSWCYSAYAGSYVQTDLAGIHIDSDINAEHIDETIAICWSLLDEVTSGQHKDKFEQRKILAIEASLSTERVTTDIIDVSVDDMISLNEIVTVRRMLNQIEKVTFEDVQKFIKEYMTKEAVYIEIFRPSASNKIGQFFKRLFGKRS